MSEVATQLPIQVVNAEPIPAEWDSLNELAKNEEAVDSIWRGGNAETSILLNLIDQTRVHPILNDIATRYPNKSIGMTTVLAGERDVVHTTDRGQRDMTLPSKEMLLTGKHEVPGYSVHYEGTGKDLQFTDGRIGRTSASFIEGLGSQAKFLHIDKRIKPEDAKPFVVVYDMEGKRDFRDKDFKPKLLAVYPVDLGDILPKQI